jgi:hypothetical protein
MSIVDAQTKPGTTHITERTVIDVLVWAIVVEVADIATVLGVGSAVRLALRIDASVVRRLQCTTAHAEDLGYSISIKGRISIFHGHLTLLFAAKSARVEPA